MGSAGADRGDGLVGGRSRAVKLGLDGPIVAIPDPPTNAVRAAGCLDERSESDTLNVADRDDAERDHVSCHHRVLQAVPELIESSGIAVSRGTSGAEAAKWGAPPEVFDDDRRDEPHRPAPRSNLPGRVAGAVSPRISELSGSSSLSPRSGGEPRTSATRVRTSVEKGSCGNFHDDFACSHVASDSGRDRQFELSMGEGSHRLPAPPAHLFHMEHGSEPAIRICFVARLEGERQ